MIKAADRGGSSYGDSRGTSHCRIRRATHMKQGVVLSGLIAAMCLSGCDWITGPEDSRQGRLYHVAGDPVRSRIDIVFLHVVDGNHKSTWHPKGSPEKYWPQWMSEDIADSCVWSFDYPAATRKTGDGTLGLLDRSRNFLALMKSEGFHRHPDRKLVFIGHSFGGLVAKQTLEAADDSPDRAWETIGERVDGVVFLATPNSGSDLASFLSHVAGFITTETVDELRTASSNLLRLNRWYRNLGLAGEIETLVFFETKKTGPVFVVTEDSADPAVSGIEPVPVERNHIGICKPPRRDDSVHKLTTQFIEGLFGRSEPCPDPDIATLIDEETLDYLPTERDLVTPPRQDPEEVTVSFENKTEVDVEIALYDWYRERVGQRGVWRYFESPAGSQLRRHQDFPAESGTVGGVTVYNGWFSLFVITPDNCEASPCLSTLNLFDGRSTRLTVEGRPGAFRLRHSVED